MKDFIKKNDENNYDIVLVDYLNLYYKYSWVFRNLSVKGNQTGCIYGFYSLIKNIKAKYNPKKIIICQDSYNNFRKSESSDYKSDRNKKAESFWIQDKILKKSLTYYSNEIIQASSVGYEADDIAAYFVNKYKDKKILLYSSDTDWLTLLINDNIKVFRKINKTTKAFNKQEIEEYILEKFGIELECFNLFSILNGVAHNNVKLIFRKKKALEIVNYIKTLNIEIKTYADILNALSFLKIEITDELIEKLEINFKIVSLQNSGFKVKQLKSIYNEERNLKFLSKYKLKSIKK